MPRRYTCMHSSYRGCRSRVLIAAERRTTSSSSVLPWQALRSAFGPASGPLSTTWAHTPATHKRARSEPEETTNEEVGAKFDFLGGALSTTASLFRLERTNIKSTDPVTNRLVPIGVERTDGLELTLAGQLPQGWQVWSG